MDSDVRPTRLELIIFGIFSGLLIGLTVFAFQDENLETAEKWFEEINEMELNQDQQQLVGAPSPFAIWIPLGMLFVLVGLIFLAARKVRTGEWLPKVEEEKDGPG